jgi:hypothetical protein
MNTEYCLNSIKIILDANIDTMINTIESESGATIFVDNIAESKVGSFLPTEFTAYPAIAVYAQNSNATDDQYEYQERQLNFAVAAWVVQVDNEQLHRFICRIGDAIVRILRNETNWNAYPLHSTRINEAVYSEVFNIPHGLAQGCQVSGSVNYILSNY